MTIVKIEERKIDDRTRPERAPQEADWADPADA